MRRRTVNEGFLSKRALAAAAMRWRWYHFYFLLAFFDIVVILTGWVVYHRSLQSYEVALRRLERIHERQRWLTHLRLTVLALNAPGNDVFASRQVEMERRRFERAREDLQQLLQRERELEVDLLEFRESVSRMTDAELGIFQIFETVGTGDDPQEVSAAQLLEAAASMAAMDRFQAAAISALSEQEQSLLMRTASLLKEHGTLLARHGSLEKWLFGVVAVILVGVFWYGRKLHRLHEQMILERQEALAQRQERLAAIGEVCSGVAHGIRNPVAAISSSAQLVLQYGALDESARSRVQDILTECRRLDRRVSRLLDFARTSLTTTERFDVREVLGQAVEELRPKFEERKIDLALNFGPRPLMIEGNRESLVQGVIEMLSNSLEQLPPAGQIRLEAHRAEDREGWLNLDVRDNGPGIPEPLRKEVFELFFTSKPHGSGIGLASVKQAVLHHGGEVFVVPTNGQGAHIRVRLPLA